MPHKIKARPPRRFLALVVQGHGPGRLLKKCPVCSNTTMSSLAKAIDKDELGFFGHFFSSLDPRWPCDSADGNRFSSCPCAAPGGSPTQTPPPGPGGARRGTGYGPARPGAPRARKRRLRGITEWMGRRPPQ